MGYEFTVYQFREIGKHPNGETMYTFIKYYEGQNKEEAFAMMEKLKKEDLGVVKLEWR